MGQRLLAMLLVGQRLCGATQQHGINRVGALFNPLGADGDALYDVTQQHRINENTRTQPLRCVYKGVF